MFGPFTSRRGAALYLLVWLMLGLILAAMLTAFGAGPWWPVLLFAVPLTLLYAVAAGFSAFYLCRANPLSGTRPGNLVLVFAGSSVLTALVWTAAAQAWTAALQFVDVVVTLTPSLRVLLFGLGIVMYVLCAFGHYLVIEFDRTRAAERRELELRLAAQDAELRMLRTQVDPHFLFNSLNSISALTSIDPARARSMTLQLSDLFRRTLGLQASRKITLEEEAALIDGFVAIEQVRFGPRLRVECELDAAAVPCMLPPLLLQPLVENAVKHGIGGLPEGGVVRISARRAGSLLRLRVENDMDPDLPRRPGNGIGLANVRQRLQAAYGHEASATWARDGNLFRVDLVLPAETE